MTLILAPKNIYNAIQQFKLFKNFTPSKLSHVTPPFAVFQNHDLYTYVHIYKCTYISILKHKIQLSQSA